MTNRISKSAVTDLEALRNRIVGAFPDVPIRIVDNGVPSLNIPTDRLVEVASYLKTSTDLGYNYLASVTAIDWLDRFEVVYQLRSIERKADVTLRVEIEHDEPRVPSVTGIWRGADFQEREIYDLMGITFTNHPDLRRILLYEEFDGHPLRKDWRLPTEPRPIPASGAGQ